MMPLSLTTSITPRQIEIVLSGELTVESEIIVFGGPPATRLHVRVPSPGSYSFCLDLDDLGLDRAEVVMTNVILRDLVLKKVDLKELEPDPDPQP